MSWTLCTSGAAVAKAGANMNGEVSTSGSVMTTLSDQAEGRIVAETRRNWVSEFDGLSTGIKNVLSDACSSLIALDLISYDMSGYTGKREAETMLDVQFDKFNKAVKILKDFKSNEIKNP